MEHPSPDKTLTCDVGEQPVQTWSAEHDGYLRLNTPATHRRSVTLDSPGRRLTVVDTFDATAAVPLRLSWHFGPDIVVELNGAYARLSWHVGPEQRQGTLVLPDGLTWTAIGRTSTRSRVGIRRALALAFRRLPCRSRNGRRSRPASLPSWSCRE